MCSRLSVSEVQGHHLAYYHLQLLQNRDPLVEGLFATQPCCMEDVQQLTWKKERVELCVVGANCRIGSKVMHTVPINPFSHKFHEIHGLNLDLVRGRQNCTRVTPTIF